MEEISIQKAQKLVDERIHKYGVRYGDQSFKPGESDNLSDEMADILWVLICLANQTGVNLTEAFQKNLEKKTNRDKERHINNPKLK